MEPIKSNANDYPPKRTARSGFIESGYPFNQVPKNKNMPSQFPPQYLDGQFNLIPGHFSRQTNVSVSNKHPFIPQISKLPPAANGHLAGALSTHPSIVGSMPFQNRNHNFQPYSPTLMPPMHSPLPLQSPVSSSDKNHRHLFSIPPPSVISTGNLDSVQFGQFRFPPPSIAPSYFSQGYPNSPSSSQNNNSQQNISNTSSLTIFPSVPNVILSQTSNYQPSSMLQIISNIQLNNTVPEDQSISYEKENSLNGFLQKFNFKEKQKAKSDITVAEFCSSLKRCFSLFNLLQNSRRSLASLLHSDQEEWEMELKHVKELQDKLLEEWSKITFPNNVTTIKKKLNVIKKKRARQKKLSVTILEQRAKKEHERERLHQEIDKWLDNLKEKNEKMKREIEMKREADNILSEVRRKIYEAKKTIEKLKVFEKLRSARQANALQKGLHLQPGHSSKFEASISHLRRTVLARLSDYEQEEKAMRVMLETEQEDRLEEEALWRRRKLAALHHKRRAAVLEGLFGNYEEPAPDDPLFLFYQYQNSGNKNIDNLIQIRHHWDVHLSEEGESIPLQWPIPVPPSNSSWEEYCTSWKV